MGRGGGDRMVDCIDRVRLSWRRLNTMGAHAPVHLHTQPSSYHTHGEPALVHVPVGWPPAWCNFFRILDDKAT